MKKNKTQHNTTCVGHHYTQTNTNIYKNNLLIFSIIKIILRLTKYNGRPLIRPLSPCNTKQSLLNATSLMRPDFRCTELLIRLI